MDENCILNFRQVKTKISNKGTKKRSAVNSSDDKSTQLLVRYKLKREK